MWSTCARGLLFQSDLELECSVFFLWCECYYVRFCTYRWGEGGLIILLLSFFPGWLQLCPRYSISNGFSSVPDFTFSACCLHVAFERGQDDWRKAAIAALNRIPMGLVLSFKFSSPVFLPLDVFGNVVGWCCSDFFYPCHNNVICLASFVKESELDFIAAFYFVKFHSWCSCVCVCVCVCVCALWVGVGVGDACSIASTKNHH